MSKAVQRRGKGPKVEEEDEDDRGAKSSFLSVLPLPTAALPERPASIRTTPLAND